MPVYQSHKNRLASCYDGNLYTLVDALIKKENRIYLDEISSKTVQKVIDREKRSKTFNELKAAANKNENP